MRNKDEIETALSPSSSQSQLPCSLLAPLLPTLSSAGEWGMGDCGQSVTPRLCQSFIVALFPCSSMDSPLIPWSFKVTPIQCGLSVSHGEIPAPLCSNPHPPCLLCPCYFLCSLFLFFVPSSSDCPVFLPFLKLLSQRVHHLS